MRLPVHLHPPTLSLYVPRYATERRRKGKHFRTITRNFCHRSFPLPSPSNTRVVYLSFCPTASENDRGRGRHVCVCEFIEIAKFFSSFHSRICILINISKRRKKKEKRRYFFYAYENNFFQISPPFHI